MKKCLQLSVLPLLLSAVLFCSCKDEDPGNPNPILGATVLSANAKVTIDQVNKRIDVLYYEPSALSKVEIRFDFVDGAYLITPMMKNPVTLDLSDANRGSTVNVKTGDGFVSYDVYGAVDYPLMGMTATADNDMSIARVVLDQASREIHVEFDNIIDPTQVKCSFRLSPEGGELVPAMENPAILDLSKPYEITAKSTNNDAVTYTIMAAETPATEVPAGWVEVSASDYVLPANMRLFKTNDLYENEAYVVVADRRAKFSVMSNGYNADASKMLTMPGYFNQDPSVAVMINGAAQNRMIVVNGNVINQGEAPTTTGFGVTKTGTLLMGKDWKVDYKSAKINDSVAYHAMFAAEVLITKGTVNDGLDKTSRSARSAIGLMARNYFVFLVCSQYNTQGLTSAEQAAVMADWKCYNAMGLEAGSGACMFVGGKRTIYSSGKVNGMPDKDFYKPIGCVGVLK